MFEITTNRTIESSNELHNQSVRFNLLLFETQSVAREMTSLSCMDETISNLRSCIRDMEDELVIYRQMAAALDKVNYCYQVNENKIVDNAEQSARSYTRRNIEVIDLNDIQRKLKNILV